MSREEIEQVEKELDEVLEIVQRPVPVKNTGREETVSLQENLQENDPLQEEMQIETEKEEKEEKEDSPESAAKEQTAVSEEELDLEDDIENGYFHFLRPSDGLIAAFFVPVAVLIILFAQRGIFPFGEECFLRTDMYHQYAPFFSEFQYKLKQGGSLLYSWDIGMGVNFSALYAYYLASPVNWLIILCPKKFIIEFMTILIMVKTGLCGVTFTWYLDHHFEKKHFVAGVFGIFYALSGYMAAYSWNIMWLDCIFLLPLILYGLEQLVQEKKGLCRITFYLEDSPDGYNTLAQVRMALSRVKQEHPEYGRLLLTMENMEDADWENNWKQFYKPMEIGDRLTVIPEWESTGVPEDRVALRLNPGLTFGTGSHATTRLCLTALEKHITGGQTVLDLGCGSGILSIAALLLGADRAVACDIDEKCMDVAYENAALNGVGRDRYTVRWGDVVTDQALRQELGGPYDVVVANIVADVIKALASTVRPLVKEGGIFLCSGIIDDRAEEVAQCLRDNGWTIAEARSSEGWFSYLCR